MSTSDQKVFPTNKTETEPLREVIITEKEEMEARIASEKAMEERAAAENKILQTDHMMARIIPLKRNR